MEIATLPDCYRPLPIICAYLATELVRHYVADDMKWERLYMASRSIHYASITRNHRLKSGKVIKDDDQVCFPFNELYRTLPGGET
ncbi:hypothetical protein GHT06_021393 [Daphnia sinensis]|uniref:Uncharacterized protein n=1 Tax=Daphnia sinensis TaxID=1820382 RepID=A0AAD5L083_9CRUS|nr:hypothetical protein GHT06_021393 [Daphnia sinensis]